MDGEFMKERLNRVSMDNWYRCVDTALGRSGLTRQDIGYLAVLHIKPSMHQQMLEDLGLSEDQSTYLRDFGHLGQIDQVLSMHLGLESGKIEDDTVVLMVAAGIGYAWAACVVRWGGAGRARVADVGAAGAWSRAGAAHA